MKLAMQDIAKTMGPLTHLYPLNLELKKGAVTVLLGATQAGKTSLMRLMAGLDVPSAGRVTVDGVDVTGVTVRHRNVSMVYQQFINYPSMTVFDNIASPLKLRGQRDVADVVNQVAERLHIAPFLQRLPAQLSGGQQQRVALARALVKKAPLMLLDEPLVNLDYKLREELREELSSLFAAGDSTVVYATTEPSEALLLGGYTAVMDAGELLQYGPTSEVFHTPASMRVARAFSDPPMNFLAAQRDATGVVLRTGQTLNLTLPGATANPQDQTLTVGVRASALRLQRAEGDIEIPGEVELAEISGSDTFVHVETKLGELVVQVTGVHFFELGQALRLYMQAAVVYVFDAQGQLLLSPTSQGVH